ncbi:BCL2/adenovirus E1B 19 kDa protein-interacting protein 3-like isoform X2 [Apostichopus japonicus]|uniref:BCL2/adenovirus E1B 19 kDa protein-interacting protein 3-like isoform X2 n=1 Tax=Stichopus japonicus TaxID=307972 RepID=UPI003AB5792F
MTSTPRSEVEDPLNESWVELNLSSQGGSGVVTPNSVNNAGGKPLPIHCTTNMEKLLMEAQRDQSRSTSRGSSRDGSPKSPHSPVLSSDIPGSTLSSHSGASDSEQGLRNTEWIWDWSSRPEHAPPKEFRFKHPENARLSLRKSKAMKSNIFSADVLRMVVPSLILTNLITLGLGIVIGLRAAAPKSSM